MKKFFAIVLILCASSLVAAGPNTETHHLTINGRVLGNVVALQGGIWAVRLEDVARALGAPITLEPSLELRGDRLFAKANAADGLKVKIEDKHKAQAGQFLTIRKSGEISRVLTVNGNKYVVVRELVNAFGDGSVRGTFSGPLKPGENVNLNLRGSNGIIAILIGL